MKKIESLQAIVNEKSTITTYQDIPANKAINKDENAEESGDD